MGWGLELGGLGAMKFEALADTANFVVVYPEGENSSWDIGGNKDVNFIVAIIDSMYNRYQIDRNRVYATGFSMGGMMSWHLSCKIPDKIAAIVPGNLPIEEACLDVLKYAMSLLFKFTVQRMILSLIVIVAL